MSDRGLTLLQLCELPPNAVERDQAWATLNAGRERARQMLLRDYARRGFITTPHYETALLTTTGRQRLMQGLEHRARR